MGQWLILLGIIVLIVIGLKKLSTKTKLRIAIILLIVGVISMFLSTKDLFDGIASDMAILIAVAGVLIGGIFLVGSIGQKKE